MDNPTFVFLALVVNRLTEVAKRAITVQFPGLKEDFVSLVVLLISFVVGSVGVIFLFPSANIFTGQGVSPFTEMVATGIVIGGLANGLDFLGGKLGSLIDRVTGTSSTKSTLTVVETAQSADAQAA